MLQKNVTHLNYGALSAWYQIRSAPDFVKAFKAISQVKQIVKESDPFGRYWAMNIYFSEFTDEIWLNDTKVRLLGNLPMN